MKSRWLLPVVVVSAGILIVCCLCSLIGGLSFWVIGRELSARPESSPTAVVLRPSPDPGVVHTVTTETLKALETTQVPLNDLRALASQLSGIHAIPLTVAPPSARFTIGDRHSFWVANTDTNEQFQILTSLRYTTDHVYFWIQEEVAYEADDLAVLVETFESQIYPTVRDFFGSEWMPGVDNDPHLYILFVSDLGRNLLGYFSSADENHPLAHKFSNAHEMFLLNADNLRLDDLTIYSVLAHEFQHMVHWYQDRNEEGWLNEGASELAAFLSGYTDHGADFAYLQNPDIQLNDWPDDPAQAGPHYRATFLFLKYFLDRFGRMATQMLVAHPENGLNSFDATLTQLRARNPQTGHSLSADDVFLDWEIANYLQDSRVSDGRYAYRDYPLAGQPPSETIYSCPRSPFTADVHQYGVDYIRIACAGDYTLHFEGSVQTAILPVDPHSGDFAFWSNRGDESDMTLTRRFDFSDYSAPLSFSYWAWYDLETDYDYLYLEASADGQNWQILNTPSGTAEDPSGNSFGWGYNGSSGGWIREEVNLSQFAGQRVWIRYQYITDAAVNGEGFLLDDVQIPQIGYSADFERDDGGWQAAGWIHLQNILPQTYRLALISFGETTTVEHLDLAPDNTADIPLHLGEGIEEVVLVVTGVTRYTHQTSGYRIEISPAESHP